MDPSVLERLAHHRAGVIDRRLLLDAGIRSNGVDRALARGQLIRIAPGVYRIAGAPWTRRAAQHAALLVAGPSACLARWSAAELHGITEPHRGPLQVVVAHGHRSSRTATRLATIRRSQTLRDDERIVIDGLTVTSTGRTLLDLAASLAVARLTELVAAAVRLGRCALPDLLTTLDHHPGAQGRARLARAVDELGEDGARSRSEVEVAALAKLADAGLPRPVMAHRVHGPDGAFVAEVDLAYPELKLAIEIDGYRWHSTPAQKRADEERQNRLVLAGWTVLRFSATQIRTDPDSFVEAVARYLTTRATGR